MATKEQTFQNARQCQARTNKVVYVYRVGPAWMYTTETFEQVQSKYKKPISQWMELK